MLAKLKTWSSDKKGNISIITALSLPVIVGLGAFGVETGLWYQINRTTQTNVDLAAYEGAVEIRNVLEGEPSAGNPTPDDPEASAVSFALAQLTAAGLVDGQGGVTVSVASPPVNSPNFAGQTNAVEVTVRRDLPRIVSGLFTSRTLSQSFSAVALTDVGNPSNSCLVSLAPNGTAFDRSGSGTIALDGCNITVNSVASNSVDVTGSGRIEAECINTAGSFRRSGSGSITLDCGDIRTNQTPVADPYSDLVPVPDNLPCDNQSPISGSRSNSISAGSTGIRRLCSGLRKSGSGDLNLGPGTYIIESNTGFDISGSGDITGNDVTFIYRNGATFDKSGSGDLNFSAPTTGDLAGILMWDETPNGFLDLSGSGRRVFEGVVYAPDATVDFTGSGALGAGECFQIVAQSISVSGSSRFRGNCPGSGIRPVGNTDGSTELVE